MCVMDLFRKEVLERSKERLHGSVHLVLPVSWQIIGLLFFAVVVAGLLFITFSSYSRIETVTGVITPESGIAQVVPTRAGTVSRLEIEAGEAVRRGDVLAIISTDERPPDGLASSMQILQSLEGQENILRGQEQQVSASAEAARAQLEVRIAGLETDLQSLESRIDVQRELVVSARQQLDLAENVAERGFISRNDLLRREETWLSRKQALTALEQTRASQQSAIHEARAAIRQGRATTGAQLAVLASQRSDIAQRKTGAAVSGAYRLEAPVAGTVTALTAKVGQAVSSQRPIMAIVPRDTPLRAELYVPTAAIGFLEPGQDVSLSIDAFPYQRFGTVPARITSIASAPVERSDASGNLTPVFLVVASLRRSHVNAFGSDRELIAGMTLSARITTEEQSLIEWLFEPIFAVRRR